MPARLFCGCRRLRSYCCSDNRSSLVKAFLLAAGLGTRLRPITETTPKCLVPIGGRPLLAHWMDTLAAQGVDEVLVNLHHLPGPVVGFAREYTGTVKLVTMMEPELLGSAGTLHAARGFVKGEEQFFILYADNLIDIDLAPLVRFNADHPAPLTVGLMRLDNPSSRGIALLDEQGTIVDFEEKPARPKSDLASTGLFVARPSLFEYITPDRRPYDLGGDVMPRLVGMMNGVELEGYLRDVGTLESLEAAGREWEDRRSRMEDRG